MTDPSSTLPRDRARRDQLDRAVADHVDRLATPALVIDLDAVQHNIDAVLRRVGSARRWRPHVKTVKQPTLVGLLLDAGVTRFKAATPAEVQLVLEAAADRAMPAPVDVLLAYPPAPPQLRVMIALRRAHPGARLGLLADSPDHAASLADHLGRLADSPDHAASLADHLGRLADPPDHAASLADHLGPRAPVPPFDLWLDVDLGMRRTGRPPADWRRATLPDHARLHLAGVHGYEGHLTWSERDAAHAGYAALLELARALPPAARQLCTSGTHAYAHALAHPGLAEAPWDHQVSPGTVLLGDLRSADAMQDLGLRQAAFVLSRVISRPGDDTITLDAGSKALAPDCPPPSGAVLGAPHLRPLPASEEHRPVLVTEGERPPRGSMQWLIPDHVCTTVNLHAEALYLRTDAVVGRGEVRARGHRPWLTLAALALPLLANTACQPITTEVDVQLVQPRDPTALGRTNNVSVVLEPDGFARTTATQGLDFGLSFEVPPDATIRTLAVYLADDDELLAWGRTPPFRYGGASGGLSLLLTYAGALSPVPFDFAQPDALAQVAPVADIGALLLASDGTALFLDAYAYTLEAAATLDEPPDPEDGWLVAAADGGVLRVAWNDGLAAWRFDAVANAWTALTIDGDRRARPGGTAWIDAERETLWLAGGGDAVDVVSMPLRGAEPRTVEAVAGLTLDSPRPNATGQPLGLHPLVIGGETPGRPAVWQADAGRAEGPVGPWVGLACASLTDQPPQLLCAGGRRDGVPTADGLRIASVEPELEVELLPGLLPQPLPDPLLFADGEALFVQGDGRWFRIERTDLAVTEHPSASPRARGGHAAPLPSGATLLVGGFDTDGDPLDRWYAFAPALEP